MPIRSEHEGISFTGLLPGYSGNREDFENMENSLFRFCRGFLLCRERGMKINSHFTERAFTGGYTLYIHEMLAVDAAADEETAVWVLGVAYFTGEEYAGADESEAAVLKRALEDSEENFYRALDHLAGRYAVLARRGEKLFVVNDPCGLKTVYYSSKAECVGSHLALVNMAARAGLSEIEMLSRKEGGYRYSYAYPGNSTCFEGIFLLVPNFSLSLGDYSVRRFFPREKLAKTDDLYAVRSRFLDAMRFSMSQLLKKGKKICMSLTGGRDSKVCFYATREYKDNILYFTEARDNDIEESRKVAAENGLRWIGTDSKDLHFDSNVYRDKFNSILNENIFPPSARFALRTQFWNLNLFGVDNAYIHIHSNCAEAGRGRVSTTDTLGEYPFYTGSYSFDAFFESYINSAAAWQDTEFAEKQKNSMRHCSVLKELLSEYFAMLDHRKVAELGYNPWDFMYIEQRTASVLSQSHMPNDGAFESLSLTNSRDILKILWSVPEQFINGSCLLFNCILNEFDPVFRARSVGRRFQEKGTPAERENYALLYGGDILCGKLKEEGQCMAIAERALCIDPTVQWPYMKLIYGYLHQNRADDALRWARKMICAVPELCRLDCCDAVCNELRKCGKVKEALAFIREILAVDDKTGWAYKHWASLCWAEKKYSEALSLAEKGYSCDSENRWVVQTYVTMLINRGQYDRAHRLLQKHMERFSAQEWPYFCMARICKAQGEREKARAYAEKAAVIKPDSEEIRSWIAALNRD